LGAVAIRVAELAQAFGMKVVTYTPASDSEMASRLGIQRIGLEKLLQQSDFISVHCKVTEETRGLLGQRAFRMVKPSAYLINTARAVVIDQGALIEALKTNRIAGAALDVFWYEPLPSNHPLLKMDNVILTPHLGGATVEVPELHSKMIIDDVFSWIEGKAPFNILNAGVLNFKN
jgi:D-3-phosphoglycerate dehydrogenase